MDHSTAASLLVIRRDPAEATSQPGSELSVITESSDHGDAHSLAEDFAKKTLGQNIVVEVYRRISTYEAEVKVSMRKDGE